jgi:hypothetical protein
MGRVREQRESNSQARNCAVSAYSPLEAVQKVMVV